MQQLEIKFFWPLTEQMPLDLDYTDCARPVYSFTGVTAGSVLVSNGGTGTWAIAPSNIEPNFRFDLDTLQPTVKQKEMPWYRRLAYKILGMKIEN